MTPPSMQGADEISGVLLAAGIGRRYDPKGKRLKLLEPAPGSGSTGVPIALAALRILRAAVADVIAVVRPIDSASQQQLHLLLAAEGVQLVICQDASAGMGRSLACGVRARSDAAGWLIALADMPAVSPSTVAAIRDAVTRGHDAVAPVHRGQRGHPVGFGRACREELLGLTGDTGARSVLAAHRPLLIDVDDPGCLLDVDTPIT